MPKVSKDSASQVTQMGPAGEDRHEDLDGYTVDFMSFTQGGALAPMLKGLPDDMCQCPHWGYVVKGRMTMRFVDHEEIYEAGDAYYAPPGRRPVRHEPGTEIVQFSPTDDLKKTQAVMMKNMKAITGG
jgi:hypothetical protein